MGGPYAIDVNDVRAAAERLSGKIHYTPALTCCSLDEMASRAAAASTSGTDGGGAASVSLTFKAEVFQRSGSFKIRGALNSVLSLDDDTAAKGVVTHRQGGASV